LDNNSRAAFLFQNHSFATVSVWPSPAAAFFLTTSIFESGRHLFGPLGNGFQVASDIEETPGSLKPIRRLSSITRVDEIPLGF
jgi:hypothetical protein